MRILLFLLLLIIVPSIYADNSLFSNQGTLNDGICDGNEGVIYPTYPDCNITNIRNALSYPWFVRLLLLIGAALLYYYRKKVDFKLVILIVAVIGLAYLVPSPNLSSQSVVDFQTNLGFEPKPTTSPCSKITYQPVCFGGINYDNLCYAQQANATTQQRCTAIWVLQRNSIEKGFEAVTTAGQTLSPTFPPAGWIVFIIVVIVTLIVVKKTYIKTETFIDRWFGSSKRR